MCPTLQSLSPQLQRMQDGPLPRPQLALLLHRQIPTLSLPQASPRNPLQRPLSPLDLLRLPPTPVPMPRKLPQITVPWPKSLAPRRSGSLAALVWQLLLRWLKLEFQSELRLGDVYLDSYM